MGLNFAYEIDKENDEFEYADFKFSYSGFSYYRETIAKLFGIVLHKMQGFCQEKFCEKESCDNCKKPHYSWETIGDDIKILLNHSDCECDIRYDDLIKLLPRLEYAYNLLNKSDMQYQDFYHSVTKKTKELIDFIKICIDKKKDLIFT